MPVSFDWDFEKEEPDPSYQPRENAPAFNGRRRWLFLGLALFTLFAVGGLSARAWLDKRLDAVEKVEDELRSIVELELQSIAAADVELYRVLQDPSIFRWQDRQVARYITDPASAPGEIGNLALATDLATADLRQYYRLTLAQQSFAPAPGLTPADRPPEIEQVRVFGHIGRVKLVHWFRPTPLARAADPPTERPASSLPQWFQSILPTSTQPLAFHVTWFYRLDEDGTWYHTPPSDTYKGAAYSWYGIWLEVHATEVEAEALNPAANDLARLVLDGCRLLGCVEGERYTLGFDGALAPQVHSNWWTLPALYLTGMPEGQAARDAWLHALKLWLVEAQAQSRASADVTNRVIYRQLVTRLQAKLGLTQAPSLDAEMLAQAIRAGEQHSLQDLWEAEYNPDDPGGNRLLDVETFAMLQWIEDQVGAERLFELLPTLDEHRRLDNAMIASFRLPPHSFDAEWSAYLSQLTGVSILPTFVPRGYYQRLRTPSLPPRLPTPIGDQITLICDSSVWVGNADGSNMVTLTTPGRRFKDLYWSPDGRQLLTAWQHGYGPDGSALYMLAANGNSGRLFTDDPDLEMRPVGWSPDGRDAIYTLSRQDDTGETELLTIDVETGATHRLPGWPTWSPNGQRMIYGDAQESTLWLADADGENARQIADQASIKVAWSPDGSELALTLLDDDPAQNTIALYDVATTNITPLLTAADLTEVVSASVRAAREGGDRGFVTHGVSLTALANSPLSNLRSWGWSADGSRLVVWGQAASGGESATAATALAVVSRDGSSPQLLAFGQGALPLNATWSPSNPNRLAFAWPTAPGMSDAYLFDLQAGPMYTATRSWGGVWSPDGAWLAFAGRGATTIVDKQGRARFALDSGSSCSAVAWNPVADLSTLGQSITLTLTAAGDDWDLTNVHITYDRLDQSLHAWGEVLNQSGSDQRIMAILPFVQAGDGNPVNHNQRITFPSGFQELIQTVSLANGQYLPFNFTIPLPAEAQLENSLDIIVSVAAESVEPARDDLAFSPGELDLRESSATFYASGAWDNPGPDLAAYVALVVTVYDRDDQVIGWGWHKETDPAHLASGAHDFAIEITLPNIVASLDLPVGSYKVQLFAH